MNKFKIYSDFQPAGDQPRAIEKLSENIRKGVKDQVLLGVTGSGKTFTIAKTIEKVQKPTLVIAHNKTLAAQLANEFRFFFPKNAVEYFVSYYDYYQPEAYMPAADVYIEKDLAINDEIDRLRHAATAALLSRKDVIVVASVSCIYGLGSPDFYREITFEIKKGGDIGREALIKELVRLQYFRDNIPKRGTFRVQGETFEIMRPDRDVIIRVEFSGSRAERIFEYEHLTGEIVSEDLESVFIYPAKHFVVSEKALEESFLLIENELADRLRYFRERGKATEAERLLRRTNYDLEMMKEIGYCNGIENYSLYLSRRKKGEPPYTLLDYFPKDFLTVIDESHVTVPQIGAMYGGDFSRKKNLVDFGFRLPSAFDNRPLKFGEFEKKIGQTVYMSATPATYEIEKAGKINIIEQIVRPTGLVDPEIEIRSCLGQVKDVVKEIRKIAQKNERVLITTLTKKMAEDLAEFLKEENQVRSEYIHSEVDTIERIRILDRLRQGKVDVLVGVNLLREGLDLPEVSLVAILDADKEGFLRSKTSLIQTIGRAARNVKGRVILYADNITGSMKEAIEETKRRRKRQTEYNKKNGITPQSVKKKIRSAIDFDQKTEKNSVGQILNFGNEKEFKKQITLLEKDMKQAAKQLDFEKAALIRDEIISLKKALKMN
jgi:excinuclease ABC subunit B